MVTTQVISSVVQLKRIVLRILERHASQIFASQTLKISFSLITPNISTLEHMLLHKSYINVAIANIFLYRNSLYDLQERK